MTERDAGARRADEATVSALAEELDAARKLDLGLAEAKVRAVADRAARRLDDSARFVDAGHKSSALAAASEALDLYRSLAARRSTFRRRVGCCLRGTP